METDAKTLIILRHAKSSWASPGVSDFDRPLNARGFRQLEVLRPWFEAHVSQSTDDCAILCSPAQRTRDTWGGIEPAFSGKTPKFEAALYNGSLDDYFQAIWAVDDSVNTLVVIGHNPTCDELSRNLAAPSSPASAKLMQQHFGTACLAQLIVPRTKWSELRQSENTLSAFVRPADLQAEPAAPAAPAA
ncbi:MAG: histidine phosphatase family protein [Pseudomonadota bacterium]